MTPLDLAQQDWLERNPDASPDLTALPQDWLCAESVCRYPAPQERTPGFLRALQRADAQAPAAFRRVQEAKENQSQGNERFPLIEGVRIVWPNAQKRERP